jgi:hypothetical protein
MDVETDGYLVFLLFIPLLWTIWIWVHMFRDCLLMCVLTHAVDDRLETCNYILRVANLLQLPGDVLFRRCSIISS